jgi:hypothetical protein
MDPVCPFMDMIPPGEKPPSCQVILEADYRRLMPVAERKTSLELGSDRRKAKILSK